MTRTSGGAARRSGMTPAFVPALKELAAAATAKGDMTEAAGALEQAMVLSPDDGNAAADLGNVYLRQGRVDDAYKALAARARTRSDAAAGQQHHGTGRVTKGGPERPKPISVKPSASSRTWPRPTTISALCWRAVIRMRKRLITSNRRSTAIPGIWLHAIVYGVTLALAGRGHEPWQSLKAVSNWCPTSSPRGSTWRTSSRPWDVWLRRGRSSRSYLTLATRPNAKPPPPPSGHWSAAHKDSP